MPEGKSGQSEVGNTFSLSWHLTAEDAPFWSSSAASLSKAGYIMWSGVIMPAPFNNLRGGLVKIWLHPPNSNSPQCLQSLIIVLASLTEVNFVPSRGRLVLFLTGGSGTLSTHLPSWHNGHRQVLVPRVGTGASLSSSYDTRLLARIQRIRRAVDQQELQNRHSCQSLWGAVQSGPEPENMSLSRQILAMSKKKSSTRHRERELRRRLEDLQVTLTILQDQHDRALHRWQGVTARASQLRVTNDDYSQSLTVRVYDFSKTKSSLSSELVTLTEARERLSHCSQAVGTLQSNMMRGFLHIYPINPADMTIRWIKFCTLEDAKALSSRETSMSVLNGWMAHILTVLFKLQDVPMKFPLRPFGSWGRIQDPGDGHVYPLFLKGSDPAQVQHGLKLLNRNIVQLMRHAKLPIKSGEKTVINLLAILQGGELNCIPHNSS
ncbi:UV radiation resistance-associated gene protein-like isoform X2 [Tigriopus californicus]|nr:UV radiation resistance-associated gene protein-like isoform X2 [Tigriopus californicus]